MCRSDDLLTVIITVYNVAPYISKCIESVMQQTYSNLEILLIDDGSTDGSGKLCDFYALDDKRIKVYHRKNQGLVLSRKFGVEIASGEIIAFVDGDDWIEPDMYQFMVNRYIKEKAEMVTSGLTYECCGQVSVLLDDIPEGMYKKSFIQTHILPKIMYNISTGKQGITASVCNKLFNRNILKEIIQNVDSQLTLGEDGVITYSVVPQVDKIVIIHQSWYHYVQHDGSMIRKYEFASFEQIYRLKCCLTEEYEKLELEDEMQMQINHYIKTFLDAAIWSLYKVDLQGLNYLFPYAMVPKNSRIILYGAGEIGCSYWRCLSYETYAEVVGWVDRNYVELQKCGLPVDSLEDVMVRGFDYIVIAINDEVVVNQVKGLLLANGVKEEQIVWNKRKRIY